MALGDANRPKSGDGIWEVKDQVKHEHPVREGTVLLSSSQVGVEDWFDTADLGAFPIRIVKTVSQGIRDLLNSGRDISVLEEWYETTREYLPDSMEISLDEQTLGGLNEASSDEAFKDFLGSLTARSADEIRREFEEKIRASPENAERLFFSAETEFFKGYYLYKKGDKQVKDNNDKYNSQM